MTVVPHPPYSPKVAMCEFFLFPRIKINLKGQTTVEGIQVEQQMVLNKLEIKKNLKNKIYILGALNAWKNLLGLGSVRYMDVVFFPLILVINQCADHHANEKG